MKSERQSMALRESHARERQGMCSRWATMVDGVRVQVGDRDVGGVLRTDENEQKRCGREGYMAR